MCSSVSVGYFFGKKKQIVSLMVVVFSKNTIFIKKVNFSSALCYTYPMRSKKISLIVILVVCICAAIALIVFRAASPREVVSDVPVSRVSESDIVEVYVRENIAALAPEDEVLGGTWYVTSMVIDESTDTGTVEYEDGHIAGTATFGYVISDDGVKVANVQKSQE